MKFKLWESSFNDLYDNIETAFPHTTRRQHATQPIEVENLRWVPFKGMKTLFIRAAVRNEDRHYSPMVLFKKVNYDITENPVSITASDGRIYEFDKILLQKNPISLRCECSDFYWRFQHWNKLDKSLYGPDRKPYERKTGHLPPANPSELPGMCKHCIKMIETLKESGIFQD